ncbi:MAG: ABC transporter ATP-binding protein [Candidatus Atribacteria bacterium]|jgi:branched-chain amino acid transport system ATP-binding protein|nr:ABC transporter ATP-binding protein [Candidatus Atribacteria bacterium]
MLEVCEVSKKFGSLVANNKISFNVEEGSIVGLIGPNGAGKTTLFNCITGMYRPTSGRVSFQGIDITNLPPYKVARLGAVRTFQIVHSLKEMSVFDNVLIGAYLREKNTEKARELTEQCIEICYLKKLRDNRAGDLAIGLQKRLELARALATNPKLLMLDECMAGLTSTEVNESVNLIKSLRDKGITFLIVEHIMEAVMPIADKVVVLNGGVKIAEDSPEAVVQDNRVIEAYLGQKYGKKCQLNSKERGK